MNEEKNDDGIIVFGKGLNGSTDYYALTREKRDEVISKLGLEKFTEKLIAQYPELSQKISNYYESAFAGNLPKEIDVSRLEPYAMTSLLESVNKKIKEKA